MLKVASLLQQSLPSVPHFEPIKPTTTLHKAFNRLPPAMQGLESTPVQIFNLFFPPKLIDLIVMSSNLYAEQKMREEHGTQERNARWEAITADELKIWLGISIHMGCIGLPPSHYWKNDGKLLGKEGLSTSQFMSSMRFQQIRRYLHITPPDLVPSSWYGKIKPAFDQLRLASQTYRIPSSNVTIDEAMLRFTGCSIHITKMPNKPVEQGYKIFALADKGYVWDFHPYSNALGLDPVSSEVNSLDPSYSETTKMVLELARHLRLKHRSLEWRIYMDNYFSSVPLFLELRKMGVGACGIVKSNLKGFPSEFKEVNKKSKLDYHFKTGVVKEDVGVLIWMDSAPVTMMTTIHSLHAEDLKYRWHPGQKSSNAAGANQVFQGTSGMELNIPKVILEYNQHKVGVDVANQYRAYYDTQLTSRRNWYPLFYWVLETALINCRIIYRDTKEEEIKHLDFRLEVAWGLIEEGVARCTGPGIGKKHLRNDHESTPTTTSSKARRLTSKTQLPLQRFDGGSHLPVYMDGMRRDCFFCRWKRAQGVPGIQNLDPPRTRWKCSSCNEPLCLSSERNCFITFHSK